jgi:hypothetical protein
MQACLERYCVLKYNLEKNIEAQAMKIRILSAVAIMAILASAANAGDPGGLLDESFERELEAPATFEEDDDDSVVPLWIALALIAAAALAAGGSGGGS